MNYILHKGVTFLICTYNGAQRLPDTLRHLAAQQVPSHLSWEVLLVNNASTDDTQAVAPRLWAELGAPAPLRLLNEPKPGKENALILGFDEAAYEYVALVDDDNWVSPTFMTQALGLMQANPRIGILGTHAEGAFEVAPPAWFKEFQAVYAVGPQNQQRNGPLQLGQGYIHGAGSVVRRQAWRELRQHGFEFTTSAKRGAVLSGAEDVELGDAMQLIGYQLWYEDSIRLRHFMPRERLTPAYLLRMARGTSASQLTSIVYYFIFRYPALGQAGFYWRYAKRLLWLGLQLAKHPYRLLMALRRPEQEVLGSFETLRLWYNLQASLHGLRPAAAIFTKISNWRSRLLAAGMPVPPAI